MAALFRVSQIKLHVRVIRVRAASDLGIRRNEETCAYLQLQIVQEPYKNKTYQ